MASEMWAEFIEFLIGAVTAHMITRVPFLTFPRLKTWNEQFPPHPEAVYVDAHLIQRVMHMRFFHWLSIIFALIPLVFGWFSMSYGSAAIGFGMWSVSGWLILSRLTGFLAGEEANWTKQLAMNLQLVRNRADSDESCCNLPYPVWQVTAVRCTNCGSNLLNKPRPDLGRPRSDGWIMGFVRLMITDGRPIVASEEE